MDAHAQGKSTITVIERDVKDFLAQYKSAVQLGQEGSPEAVQEQFTGNIQPRISLLPTGGLELWAWRVGSAGLRQANWGSSVQAAQPTRFLFLRWPRPASV